MKKLRHLGSLIVLYFVPSRLRQFKIISPCLEVPFIWKSRRKFRFWKIMQSWWTREHLTILLWHQPGLNDLWIDRNVTCHRWIVWAIVYFSCFVLFYIFNGVYLFFERLASAFSCSYRQRKSGKKWNRGFRKIWKMLESLYVRKRLLERRRKLLRGDKREGEKAQTFYLGQPSAVSVEGFSQTRRANVQSRAKTWLWIIPKIYISEISRTGRARADLFSSFIYSADVKVYKNNPNFLTISPNWWANNFPHVIP